MIITALANQEDYLSTFAQDTTIEIEDEESSQGPASCSTVPDKKQTSVTSFFTRQETKEYRASRMAAQHRLSFSTIAEPKNIRDGLIALGYSKPPRSHNTIKAMIKKVADQIRDMRTTKSFRMKLKTRKLKQQKFSALHSTNGPIILTSVRYLNVNVATFVQLFNLGLVPLFGCVTATNLVRCVEKRLSEFGLNLKEHMIAATTDGASVMVAFGRLLDEKDVFHQQCFAHGFHLAVQ